MEFTTFSIRLTTIFMLLVPISTTRLKDSLQICEKSIATFNALNYIEKRTEQMNLDVSFALSFAEANLLSVLENKNILLISKYQRKFLNNLYNYCKKTHEKLRQVLIPQLEDVNLQFMGIDKPSFWKWPINWRELGDGDSLKLTNYMTYEDVVELAWKGSPNETQSSECLSSLIHAYLKKKTNIPQKCAQFLTSNEHEARGYPLTHRLLTLQLARTLGFKEDLVQTFEKTAEKLCKAIHQDLIDIKITNFQYNTRDLAMEQILLCGMEGFLEFTNKLYEDLILNWPHEEGCFSSFHFPSPLRKRRSSEMTDYGCDNHATGMAVATLSFLIRKDVEVSLNDA
ncbi:UPF0764 protein C16orf89 homolog [Prorops nasuta]|uniref:UPF0764 protein C16orf89 homolog n=1 Tax=Prorops nasuta TaxID=863751 RepID=UPI0034CE986B